MEECKLQGICRLKPATLLKLTLLHGCFSLFLNCANGAKWRNALQMVQSLIELGKILLHYSRKKDIQSPRNKFTERDFFNVTFNLAIEKYFPFQKANNNTPLYINLISNYPPTVIKLLSKMINRRISDISCNEKKLGKVKSVNETALKDSGHFSSMSCNNSNTQDARNRKRNVI